MVIKFVSWQYFRKLSDCFKEQKCAWAKGQDTTPDESGSNITNEGLYIISARIFGHKPRWTRPDPRNMSLLLSGFDW